MALVITGLMVAVCGAPAHAAAPGDLDHSFSGDGRVALLSSDSFVAKAVAIDKQNRIVVAGYSCDGSSDATCISTGESNFRLARLTPSGDLDYEFGKAGFAQGQVGEGRSQAFDVIQDPDGTILAGGVARSGGRDVFALVRYTADGAPDPSFGSGGVVLQPIGSSYAELLSLHPAADGSILAAGQAIDGEGVPRMAVARFRADGSLDPGFGTGGFTLGGEAPFNFATTVTQAPNGLITAAGISGPSSSVETYGVGELRLNGAGRPIDAFGGDGSASQRPGSGTSLALSVVPAADGGFLVAGGAQAPNANAQMMLIRGTRAGVPDPSFGADGVALFPQLGAGQINDLIPYRGGRVLAIGQLISGGRYSFSQTRVLANGRLDHAWGPGGTRRIAFDGVASARAVAGALTAGGRIVTVGVGCIGGDALKPTCDGGREVLLASRQLGAAARDTTPPRMTIRGLPARVSARRLHRSGVHVRVSLNEPARVEIVAWRDRRRLARLARAGLARHVQARLHLRTHTGPVRIRVRAVDRAGNATSRPFTLHVT